MRRFDQINVIPFIDIMLVLLAIVLTTATFIAQGEISVNLPDAQASRPASDQSAVVITVDAAGALFVDGAPVTLDALRTRLDMLAKTQRIVFRVDRKTEFGQFVAVIDALKGRGLDRLTVRTLPAA